MASILGPGFGTVLGTRAAPVTLYDSTVDGGKGNAYTIANTDATNWLFVVVGPMNVPPLVVLPGERTLLVFGPPGANNVMKVTGWAATPQEAGSASIVATGTMIKVA